MLALLRSGRSRDPWRTLVDVFRERQSVVVDQDSMEPLCNNPASPQLSFMLMAMSDHFLITCLDGPWQIRDWLPVYLGGVSYSFF